MILSDFHKRGPIWDFNARMAEGQRQDSLGVAISSIKSDFRGFLAIREELICQKYIRPNILLIRDSSWLRTFQDSLAILHNQALYQRMQAQCPDKWQQFLEEDYSLDYFFPAAMHGEIQAEKQKLEADRVAK